VILKLLLKLTVYDIAIYPVQHIPPPTRSPIHISTPSRVPRSRHSLRSTAASSCTRLSTRCTTSRTTLVGRVLLRQPGADRPALSARLWTATSIAVLWSFRWQQFFRYTFVAFGARPGGALLGRPGAPLGVFGVSGVLNYVDVWRGRSSAAAAAHSFSWASARCWSASGSAQLSP